MSALAPAAPPRSSCVRCGAPLSHTPVEAEPWEVVLECDGRAVVTQEHYDEALILLGAVRRGDTYQLAIAPCGREGSTAAEVWHPPHREVRAFGRLCTWRCPCGTEYREIVA